MPQANSYTIIIIAFSYISQSRKARGNIEIICNLFFILSLSLTLAFIAFIFMPTPVSSNQRVPTDGASG